MLILLILVPLVWILRFKDRCFGFVVVVSSMIASSAILSIFLQSFGVFKFGYLLSLWLLVVFLSIYLNFNLIKNEIKSLKKINYKSLSWFLLFALSIISMQFYFVHFDYSGKISTFAGFMEVENFNSGQPYFSDEWIAVAMSEKSIETGKLPFINALDNSGFQNFLFVFHSSISGIDLLLDLNLLTAYQVLSIVFAMILICFTYVLLRSFEISVGVSILIIFLISYLPNSSNLPILWYLLPWNIGLIFFVAYLVSVKKRHIKWSIILNIFSIIFYPPLVVLSLPSFVFMSLMQGGKKDNIKNLKLYLGIVLLGFVGGVLFLSLFGNESLLEILIRIYDFLFRDLNSQLGEPPRFLIWRVVPWFAVPFAFWSLWTKKKEISYLTAPIFIGLSLWFLYSVRVDTILIDYHRIVAITSILLLIIASFSIESLKDFLINKIKIFQSENAKNFLLFGLLMLMFILSFSFTQREGWLNFRIKQLYPSPPANQYLHSDDIYLFSGIKNEIFLAPPWKSLVLSVATKNIPLVTKPSTITISKINYENFLVANCNQKKYFTNRFKIKYVYTPEFKCDGFELLGTSSESLSLYLVK